jgi:hypothetical protein
MEYLNDEHLSWLTAPGIFQPLKGCMLRSNSAAFRDLKGQQLSVVEKDWLCNEVLGRNPEHTFSCTTKKGLIARYNLYPCFFQKNMETFLKLGHCLPQAHPIAVEPMLREKVHELVQTGQEEMATISEESFRGVLQKCRTATEYRKRGLSATPLEEIVRLTDADTLRASKRYCRDYCQREGIARGKPDKTTAARDNACKCPFMSFVWYVVCEALSSKLPATHKRNADATTYEFTSREANGKVVYFKENPTSFKQQIFLALYLQEIVVRNLISILHVFNTSGPFFVIRRNVCARSQA